MSNFQLIQTLCNYLFIYLVEIKHWRISLERRHGTQPDVYILHTQCVYACRIDAWWTTDVESVSVGLCIKVQQFCQNIIYRVKVSAGSDNRLFQEYNFTMRYVQIDLEYCRPCRRCRRIGAWPGGRRKRLSYRSCVSATAWGQQMRTTEPIYF